MASTRFDAFLPEVAPLVPGCPNPVAVNAIRNAAIEFCTETLVWQEAQEAFSATSTDFPMTLDAPSGTRAVQVVSMTVGGVPVDPVTEDDLDRTMPSWRTQSGDGVQGFYQPDDATVSVYPLPANSLSFQLRVAYSPTRAASSMSADIAQRHMEAIAAGALARLMDMPAQPWSNPDQALVMRGRFNNAIHNARIAVNKSRTRAPLQVQMRRFA